MTHGLRAAVTAAVLVALTPTTVAHAGSAAAVAHADEPVIEHLIRACRPGQLFDRVVTVEGFETGRLPFGGATDWGVRAGTDGVGRWYAYSAARDAQMTVHVLDRAPSPLYLSYRSDNRWDDEGWTGDGGVIVNGQYRAPDYGGRSWSSTVLALDDVFAGRRLTVGYSFHGLSRDTFMSVDDSRLYTCRPDGNARVRGDWTGEGVVDVVAGGGRQSYSLFAGRGDGTVKSDGGLYAAWNGIAEVDWAASPGDVTGDGRSDLLDRDATTGQLRLHRGQGGGYIEADGTTAGTGWNGTLPAAVGDLDLDGTADLVATQPDGSMVRYRVNAAGVRTVGPIGTGWSTTRLLVGTGDVNRDRRGDLYAIRADHCLYLYRATPTGGLAAAARIGCGWTTTTLLASPGDLDRDGTPDLLARRTDGSLWRYSLNPGGLTSRTAVKIGTGWNAYTAIA